MQLAEVMNVTPSTVTGWETGRSSPHFQVLVQLRDFFEIDLERLVFHDLQQEKLEGNSTPVQKGKTVETEEILGQIKDRMDGFELRLKKLEGE